MKTSHLSASLSRKAGGIFEIELALAKALKAQGVAVKAHGLEDNEWTGDRRRWNGIEAAVYPVIGPRAIGYSPGMLDAVLGDNSDLAHLHTLWMYPGIAIQQWHRKTGKPYVVTPNGMLEPWALANSAWKKKLAGWLYENRMLHGAACLQANTQKELRDFRAYGLKNPVCIIPNGVDLAEIGERSPETRDRKKILLFLGRMHPKKGLVNALRAWNEVRGQEEWQFVITGWDQGGHRAELEQLCREIGVSEASVPVEEFLASQCPGSPQGTTATVIDTPLQSSLFQSTIRNQQSTIVNPPSVLFLGPAFGEQKDALLRRADAFILPSFSEGLPMAVLEAWSYRLPVLMTEYCNIPEGFAADAAIRIGTGIRGQEAGDRDQPIGIDEGMRVLMEMSDAERMVMGQRGRALVERQFTWPQVAAQMKEVYEWVLGGGARPASVELA